MPLTYNKSNNKHEKPKILVVDDEPDINILYHSILERAGYTVESYENPLLALSNFIPYYYDVAILDIKMPEMNGLVPICRVEEEGQKNQNMFFDSG